MHKRGLILIVVCAALLAVSPAQGRVADHNPVRTADPAGDSNGAPDITGVTVANDLSGVLLFVVQVGNREGVVANDLVTFLFDSDLSSATGQGGVDFIIRIDGTTQRVFFVRWNGTAFESVATTSLRAVWDSGYVVAINRTELGNTGAFDFLVVTSLANGTETQFDLAPEGQDGHYEVSAPHVGSITPRFSPAAPKAGATFRLNNVTLKFETDETAAARTFSCRATLAGKRLRGTGPGGCTFKLPKTAKRKQLVVTVTVTPAGGKAQAFPAYRFRVR